MISVRCSFCGKVFLVPDNIRGQRIYCTYCAQQVLAVRDTLSKRSTPADRAARPWYLRRWIQAIAAVVLIGILTFACVIGAAGKRGAAGAAAPAVLLPVVPEPPDTRVETSDAASREQYEQERRERMKVVENAQKLVQQVNRESEQRQRVRPEQPEDRTATEASTFGRILEDAMAQRREDEEKAHRQTAQHAHWDAMAWQRAWRDHQRRQEALEQQKFQAQRDAALMAEWQMMQQQALEHQRQLEIAAASRPVMIQETNTNVQAGAISGPGWGWGYPGYYGRSGYPYRPYHPLSLPSWGTAPAQSNDTGTHNYVIKGSALR